MKKILHRSVLSALALALVTAVGCATDAPGDDGTADETGETAQAVTGPTHSFSTTCKNPHWDVNSQVIQAIVSASSSGCQQLNGAFGAAQHWSGTCFQDVSNCNGRIVCQSHCP
jgi:hypothetical protein